MRKARLATFLLLLLAASLGVLSSAGKKRQVHISFKCITNVEQIVGKTNCKRTQDPSKYICSNIILTVGCVEYLKDR